MSAPKVDPTRMVDFFGTKVCTKFDTKFDTKFGTKGWSADNMVDFFGTAMLCSDSSLVVPGYTKLFHKEPAYHNWSFSGKPNDLSSLLTLIKVCDLFFYFAFFFLRINVVSRTMHTTFAHKEAERRFIWALTQLFKILQNDVCVKYTLMAVK